MTNQTISKLYSFITKIISLLEEELEELGVIKYKNTVLVKKNITETLNKVVHLIIQLNKLDKDGYLNNDDTNIERDDELIIAEYLNKYQ